MTSAPANEPQAPAIPAGHPKAFWFFFWGEFAERASFYGMLAILPLYLKEVLHFDDGSGGKIIAGFKMACYLLPLLGGYLADKVLGRYWTIVGFSLPYVLGHFVLGIENQTALLIALALLAGGSGVIKPNISSLMGQTYDQLRPGQEQLRSSAFLWYYFAINIGSLISTLALPYLRSNYGYAIAFQFPAWLMVGALAIFASGKSQYAVDTISNQPLTADEKRERREVLGKLAGIFLLIIFFWISYEQHTGIWVYFINKYVNLTLGVDSNGAPWGVDPDQLQVINPATVMIFAPLFGWLFQKFDPESRVLTAGNRMLAGFLLMALSTTLLSFAGFMAVASAQKVSLGWIIFAYFFMTIAEILVYGTGLELAYSIAPRNLKSFVTACFLLTSACGSFVNVWLSHYYDNGLPPGQFFALSTGIVLVASVAFYFVSRSLQKVHSS